MTKGNVRVEFPRPVPIDTIGSEKAKEREITATAAECAALAKRLDLQGLHGLTATVALERLPGDEIVARGRVVADVVQTCVVTLEPVSAHIDETFEVRFTTRPELEVHDADIGPEDEDPMEPLEGDFLDIGELAAQQLALALDPWPRLPGVELPTEAASVPERDGPFAVLARLRESDVRNSG